MELNNTVLNILKNFASINSSIVFNEGNEIKTISEARNILASAQIEQEFPQQFGIYDLNEFLSVLSLVDRPRLKFEENYLLIGDQSGRSKIKYFFTDVDMLVNPPSSMNMPEPDLTFELSSETMGKIKKAASALGHSDLVIRPGISLSVCDIENNTSNTFSIDIDGESSIDNFTAVISIENLKLISSNYTVEISSKNIAKFTDNDNNLVYYIALEKTSIWS
jgi:hypothetical protein